MNRFLKIFLIFILFGGLTIFWYLADEQDYFQSNYLELTEKQNAIFKWQDEDDSDKLMNRFRQHFTNQEFIFPRQTVTQVRLFRNIPMLAVFTNKTLKHNKIDSFLKFCNDTSNFDWGETTWGISESEYYFKLYGTDNRVVGKIYFCLDGCRMTNSRPFCPSMKFGGLSEQGLAKIKEFINNNENFN